MKAHLERFLTESINFIQHSFISQSFLGVIMTWSFLKDLLSKPFHRKYLEEKFLRSKMIEKIIIPIAWVRHNQKKLKNIVMF